MAGVHITGGARLVAGRRVNGPASAGQGQLASLPSCGQNRRAGDGEGCFQRQVKGQVAAAQAALMHLGCQQVGARQKQRRRQADGQLGGFGRAAQGGQRWGRQADGPAGQVGVAPRRSLVQINRGVVPQQRSLQLGDGCRICCGEGMWTVCGGAAAV